MTAIVNWLTERSFTYLDVVATVIAVMATQHWPLWASILVVVAAVMVATFISVMLRRAVHLPGTRGART